MEKRLERKKYNDLFIDDTIVCVEILKEDTHICTNTQTNELLILHYSWMDLKGIMLSEKSNLKRLCSV